MTDIRRTLLWVVFSMSLLLLWDGWNKHNGRPSLFTPAAVKAPEGQPKTTSASSSLPTASVLPSSSTSVPGVVPANETAASAPPAQPVVVTTDAMKATLDPRGGDFMRLELLGQADQNDRTRNVLVFDQSPERLYKAQTGLIATQGGGALPNHLTPMTVLPGERTLAPGAGSLEVVFESPDIGGVKLTKTYTFRRGDYVVGVRHQVVNTGTQPVSPQLYLQLVRDGNAPAGESSFYFTFTGPAVYTDADKFTKVEFKAIEKREPGDKLGHASSADNGWVAMVQHYFASAWLLGATPDAGDKRPREFFTRKVGANQYAVGMLVGLKPLAPVPPDACT